ncbi:hypothetical protein [Deinococcus aerophilus]|uniref:Uncharacterized protein n=1 Tax=Deinococcus aerophilus TaxID=522488 RepID=A0ABQ2GME8_9DEIO|nr:hypothetical protein [Deinococcus aerophilus]GGM03134.1 hypothetical protein GCM10010841_09490 [Deinococcus aerophilus]
MLDNILNSVRRGAERVQRRGEEVAHVTRLRLEVFQLGRELDGLFARLGRAYHSGAEAGVLEGVQQDIRRVEEEISARERLISELGDDPHEAGDVTVYAPGDPAAQAAGNRPNFTPHPPQEPNMTRPDKEQLEQQRGQINLNQTDRSHHDASQGDYTSPDPTVQHSDELLEPGDKTAGVAREAERDKAFRHANSLDEAKRASENPDPLDM